MDQVSETKYNLLYYYIAAVGREFATYHERGGRRAYLLNTFLSGHDTEIGNCPFDLSRRVTASDGRAAAWRRGLKLLIANVWGGETKLSEIGYKGVKKKK